jgi:hypothetical protein
VSRFGIAAAAMSPFLLKANKEVLKAGMECGIFIALGYITQVTPAGEAKYSCLLRTQQPYDMCDSGELPLSVIAYCVREHGYRMVCSSSMYRLVHK